MARRCQQAPAVMPRRLLACLLACLLAALPCKLPLQLPTPGTLCKPASQAQPPHLLRCPCVSPRPRLLQAPLPALQHLPFLPSRGLRAVWPWEPLRPRHRCPAHRHLQQPDDGQRQVRLPDLSSSAGLEHWPGVAWQHLRCSAVLPVCLRTACCRPAPSVRPLPACVPSCLQRGGAAG